MIGHSECVKIMTDINNTSDFLLDTYILCILLTVTPFTPFALIEFQEYSLTGVFSVQKLFLLFQTAVLLLRILQHSNWFNHCSFPDSYKCGCESSKHSDTFHCIASTDKTGSNYSNNSVEETDMNMTKSLNNVVDTSYCINRTMSEIHTASDCRNKGTENSRIRNIHHDDETSNLNAISKCALHSVPDKILAKSATDFHDAEIYIGGLLLRHIQQLVCNAHAITEVKGTQAGENTLVEETDQVRVATAIYPTASLMNHSCDPTIISRLVWILSVGNV